jgi:hypothetical protein
MITSRFTHRLRRHAVVAILVATLAGRATGQVTVTATVLADASTFTVANTDLLQTSLGTAAISGSFNFFGTGSLGTLTDGNFGAAGVDTGSVVSFQTGASVTFNFDLTVNSAGYNLTEITTYTGWDDGRDGQEYALAYSTVSAPTTFLSLAAVGPFGDAHVGHPTDRVRVTISDLLAGPLVGNVAAVRFTFTGFENNSSAWREIDVTGSAVVVPEPDTSACALALVASVAALLRRRLRRTVRLGSGTL